MHGVVFAPSHRSLIIRHIQLLRISFEEIDARMTVSDKVNTGFNGLCAAGPKGVDDAVGVSGVKWFVAIVNSRHEKAVADKLRVIGTESYVATQKEMRVWSNGKRKMIERVVIPSMVFIRCTEAARRNVVKLPYINRFLVNRTADSGSMNNPVAVIPERQMQRLMFMLGHSDTPVNFVSTLYRVKDSVRVIRGPLKGLEGEITENSDGTHSLAIGLSLLGGAVVRIEPYDVERIATV